MMKAIPWPWARLTALATGAVVGLTLTTTALAANNPGGGFLEGDILPTGMKITPTAAPNSDFQWLIPDPTKPDLKADHAVNIALSPDGKTLLVLTSGYNNYNYPTGDPKEGQFNPAVSTQYVFVYDITNGMPSVTQVIPVDNTFNGIAWNPKLTDGKPTAFYVSGGVNDNVHVYGWNGVQWSETASIPLGHTAGVGVNVAPQAAGIAVNASGTRLLVANYENDSVSLIDLASNSKVSELDLRPGGGQPGGTYPFAVIFKGDNRAYVSSYRDRELIAIAVNGDSLSVEKRISTAGQPNKMTLNRDQSRLYVACDNNDTVLVVDTAANGIIEEIPATAPALLATGTGNVRLKGANPNNLALSPDEGTLFVSDGGLNAIAVIQLAQAATPVGTVAAVDDDGDDDGRVTVQAESQSKVIGLIPTGWYPNAVAVSPDGARLYVVNGKSTPVPNPKGCRQPATGSQSQCSSANQYVWQLEKAGFLTMPMPNASDLAQLTWQVAYNDNFPQVAAYTRERTVMAFLRKNIKHVIYIVKENRTYDQVLGDLDRGNGDPSLAILGPYAPNHQALARQFVTLDNFYDSGETSGVGWNWSTAARTTDSVEKTQPVNYARSPTPPANSSRGLAYDWEGTNRNIDVAYPTVAGRKEANPAVPDDPNVLAGTADVAAPDSPQGEVGTGYLWDAALRAGLTVRNYGFYGDLARYFLPSSDPNFIPLLENPQAAGSVQFYPTKQSLMPITDVYFRGYDQNYPDVWRYKEWEREFDGYVANNNLPNLMLVRLPHDHFGSYSSAVAGLDTVPEQMGDNDYAVGLLVQKVANSKFKDSTLIFIIEDDAQDGPDHVDAHRSIAYVIGPYVKQGGAVVSTHYTTVSMLRTMEAVLGLEPLGLNDGLARPMADVFDLKLNRWGYTGQSNWNYTAIYPDILQGTGIIQIHPPVGKAKTTPATTAMTACDQRTLRTAAYWEEKMRGQNFEVEDKLDTPAFNQALWEGLKGEHVPYPVVRDGRDLRANRQELLRRYQIQRQKECETLMSTR